ncbi:glycosyltransferase family 2 protein [Pseudomonadota bacterium]
MLSVVIPAHNEEKNIVDTVNQLHSKLAEEDVFHEIIVVNDNSSDNTAHLVRDLASHSNYVFLVNNSPPNGFGFAVKKGLQHANGQAIALFMADLSDSPSDLVKFYRVMEEKGVDCVFGSRFTKESTIIGYPKVKLVLNRVANWFIKVLFGLKYNDVTNAFKLYRREVIEGVSPILSHHFNITVELPLKAIIRGYTFVVCSNDWYNRRHGLSKLKIKEMGSRYMFIILYCFLEKWLSKGDYHSKPISR